MQSRNGKKMRNTQSCECKADFTCKRSAFSRQQGRSKARFVFAEICPKIFMDLFTDIFKKDIGFSFCFPCFFNSFRGNGKPYAVSFLIKSKFTVGFREISLKTEGIPYGKSAGIGKCQYGTKFYFHTVNGSQRDLIGCAIRGFIMNICDIGFCRMFAVAITFCSLFRF